MPADFQAPITSTDLATGSALVAARGQEESRERAIDVAQADTERKRIADALKKKHRAEVTGDVAALLSVAAIHALPALGKAFSTPSPKDGIANAAPTSATIGGRTYQSKEVPTATPTPETPQPEGEKPAFSSIEKLQPYAGTIASAIGSAFGTPTSGVRTAVGLMGEAAKNRNIKKEASLEDARALRRILRQYNEAGSGNTEDANRIRRLLEQTDGE